MTHSLNELFSEIKQNLRKESEPAFALGMKKFFKEEINPIGVRRPKVRRLVNEFYLKHKKNLSFKHSIELCEKLMEENIFEYTDFAVLLIQKEKKNYSKASFKLFEKWIQKFINNWAHCDTLCPHSIGFLIESYPEFTENVFSWSDSKNRWLKRASIVSYVNICRKKDYSKEIIKTAENLLNDKDDLIQKACGWALREAAKKNKKEIISFIRKNKLKMPRTMLRYSIERFNEKEKKELMKK